ncbi:MAG: porin [Patescibacteria group bacterium]
MGFVWLILLALVVSAIVKNMTAADFHRAEQRTALYNDMNGITDRFYAVANPIMRAAQEKGPSYGAMDFIRDRNALFAISDTMGAVQTTPPSTISWLQDLAARNITAQGKIYALEMGDAERALGAPSIIREQQERNVNFLTHAPVAVTRHSVWFGLLIMPFLLVGRMLYVRRSVKRAAVDIFYHPAWFATCSMLWPFMALKHADVQPRVTLRFFYLRFAYMWSEGRMFLTVAEKNELLSAVGKPGESVRIVFEMVKAAPALATETGRRYAMVSFLAALFGFGSFSLQPAMAQTATQQTQVQPEKPSLSAKGFIVTTLTATSSQQGVGLNYLRVSPTYRSGRWLATVQVDPTGSTHVKYAYVQYTGSDSGDVRWSVEAGRLISNYAYLFAPPPVDQQVRTPLDDILGLPFFDNGVLANVSFRGLTARIGALNGSGGYDDDNVQMDVTARLTAAGKLGTVGATYLSGMQPDGMRQFVGFDATTVVGPITLKGTYMERNTLQKQNGIATQVVYRAGPAVTVAAQYEHATTADGSVELGDFGLNYTLSKQARIMGHAVIGTDCRPVYKLRLVHTF